MKIINMEHTKNHSDEILSKLMATLEGLSYFSAKAHLERALTTIVHAAKLPTKN